MWEVAIAPRRNIFGKHFAFARFTYVADDRLLAVCLDNIMINGKKIHVNLPRFSRTNEGFDGRREDVVLGKKVRVTRGDGKQSHVQSKSFRKPDFSYAEVVTNEGSRQNGKTDLMPLFKFQSDDEFRDRMEKDFVGKVVFQVLLTMSNCIWRWKGCLQLE